METIDLKEKVISKLSKLEDGTILNLSEISCPKQVLSTLIFRYKNGKKEFHPDFEKYIEKIDFNGIDFSHFNCIGFNFERLTGVKIDPQSIYKRSLEHAKCKGVTFIGTFDNVRITNTDFTGSKNARIAPCKVQDRNLENSIYKDVCFIDLLDDVKTEGAIFTGSYTELPPRKRTISINFDTEFNNPVDELMVDIDFAKREPPSNKQKVNIKSLFRKRKI